MKETRLRGLSAAVYILALTLIEYRVIDLLQLPNLGREVDAALGILSGHPHWPIYQGRLLGPWLVSGLSQLTHRPFADCYQSVCFGLLLAANGTCFTLFNKAAGDVRTAWAYTIAYAALFVAFQDKLWLYLWDYIDAITVLLFARAVFVRRPVWQLAVLFFVELLNRESAVLIALWIVIDAVRPAGAPGRGGGVNGPQAVLGACLVAVSIGWTQFIRAKLMISPVYTAPLPGIHTVGGQFWMLPHVAEFLGHSWRMDGMIPVLATLATVLLLCGAWKALGNRAWQVALIVLGMMASIYMFAFITELRVWLEMLPFWLWLNFVRTGEGSATVTCSEAP